MNKKEYKNYIIILHNIYEMLYYLAGVTVGTIGFGLFTYMMNQQQSWKIFHGAR